MAVLICLKAFCVDVGPCVFLYVLFITLNNNYSVDLILHKYDMREIDAKNLERINEMKTKNC